MEMKISEFVSKNNTVILFVKAGDHYMTLKGFSREDNEEKINTLIEKYKKELTSDKLLYLIRMALVKPETDLDKLYQKLIDETDFTYYTKKYYEKGDNEIKFSQDYITDFIITSYDPILKSATGSKKYDGRDKKIKVRFNIECGELMTSDTFVSISPRKPKIWNLFDISSNQLNEVFFKYEDKDELSKALAKEFDIKDIVINVNNDKGKKYITVK